MKRIELWEQINLRDFLPGDVRLHAKYLLDRGNQITCIGMGAALF